MTEPILVDVHAAATAGGVTPDVIRQWAHRGYITRHGTRGRRLYDVREVSEHAAAGHAGQHRSLPSHSDDSGPRVPTHRGPSS